MRDEVKHGSFYLLLQDDGPTLGRHQEQHREEGEDGVSMIKVIPIDDYTIQK